MNYNNDSISRSKKVKKYVQITYKDRINLDRMYNSRTTKFTLLQMASNLGVDKSTIKREIERNGTLRAPSGRANLKGYRQYKYTAKKADDFASSRTNKIKNSTKFKFLIEWANTNIEYDDSMYTVLQKFINENPKAPAPCETTLYYWWHKGFIEYKTLRRPRKKRPNNYKNNQKIENAKTLIDQRPNIVSAKTEFGHWELDTVYDGDKKGGLLTINELKTRMFFTIKIPDRKAFTIFKELHKFIIQIGVKYFKTLTSDNGTEFAHFNRITAIFDNPWFFCHPYSSWERGQNEHLNGEMRFYYPKGTLFHNVSQEVISQKCDRINNKPRKILSGLSSRELFDIEISLAN